MGIKLSALEARVVGALIEKEVTTPEVYPMTLNGLTTACNQKSNRDPVLSLSESDVRGTLDLLQQKHLVMRLSGQRSVKYKQRLCNTEFSAYQFSEQERAVICLLLLRGAQTPGELRSRSGRLAEFSDVAAVDTVLTTLQNHEKGPLVQALAREPGKREVRYVSLLLADLDVSVSNEALAPVSVADGPSVVTRAVTPASSSVGSEASAVNQDMADRLAALEARVLVLEEKLLKA
jgi:uncharacterized protein YceH (UPF0502 family)